MPIERAAGSPGLPRRCRRRQSSPSGCSESPAVLVVRSPQFSLPDFIPAFPPLAQLRPRELRSAGPRLSYWRRAESVTRRPDPDPSYSTHGPAARIHPFPARPWRHGHLWRGGAVRATGGYPDGSLGSGRREQPGQTGRPPKLGDRPHEPTGRASGIADCTAGDQTAVGRLGLRRIRAGLFPVEARA